MRRWRFTSRSDWERELGALVGDLRDVDGEGSVLGVRGDGEAVVALEKIRAVYPMFSDQEIVSFGCSWS